MCYDDNTTPNVSTCFPNGAILESAVYDEKENNLTVYVRLIKSIKSIKVNYIITRDGNTESIENGTV